MSRLSRILGAMRGAGPRVTQLDLAEELRLNKNTINRMLRYDHKLSAEDEERLIGAIRKVRKRKTRGQ